jgi:hypothetical protein
MLDGDLPSLSRLLVQIKDETRQWAMAGALGLNIVLPDYWDVHY